MRHSTLLACASAFGVLLGGLLQASQAQAGDAARGKALAEQHCSRCHAIGTAGESPMAEAPPFREVVQRYPPEALQEALAEGITVGHPEMPEFVFEPDEIADLITFLNTLVTKDPE